MAIHSTAVIDNSAEIDPSVEIGAYAIVEGNVRIGANTRLYPHAYISEGTRIGERCQIHPFAVVGHPPQDTKWNGAPSYTEIGDETIIREGAQIHRGTLPESTTIIGKRVFLMANAHVGHNCTVGDDVVMANCSMLAGHVEVGARAFLSGLTGAHQFCRIGELVMLGGANRISADIPPFMTYLAGGVIGPNTIGLRRAGFTAAERTEIRSAYKLLFRRGGSFRDAVAQLAETAQSEPARRLVEFLQGPTKRGFERYHRRDKYSPEDAT